MAIPPDLLHQLRRIREIGSPVRRMSLLLAVWRRVRRLTSAERREAVRQIGVEPFKPLLEKLGKRSGARLDPDEIVGAMDRLDEMDPSKVGALFQLFRTPRGRRELAQKGIDFLEGYLGKTEAESSAPPLEEEPLSGSEPSASLGLESRSLETPSEAPSVILPLPVPEILKAQPPSLDAGESATTETGSEQVEREEEAPASLIEVPPPKRSGPSVVEPPSEKRPSSPALPGGPSGLKKPAQRWERALEPEPPKRPTALSPVVSQATAVPPILAAGRLLEQLAAGPPLLRRFRYVSEFLVGGGRLSSEQIREVLGCYPDGWARRRVLAAFLREGLPPDLEDAAALIEELSRLSDRRWCALILLRTRSLDPDDLARLEEMVPLPRPARRLHGKTRVHRGPR